MTARSCPSCGGVLATGQATCLACGADYAAPAAAARAPLVAAAVALAAAAILAVVAYGYVADEAEREAARVVPVSSAPSAPAASPDAPPQDQDSR